MKRVNRAAVVVNPTKVTDLAAFRHSVRAAMAHHRWSEPLWLETTASDTGPGQVQEALRAEVDLVLAAGGDGTVTACAAGLLGSKMPLGILPTGTGNLLAINFGIPPDLDKALAIALTGVDREIDVGVANGRPFVGMAGLGIDAKMLDSTSEEAKRRWGYVAYVLGALRHLRDQPMHVKIRTDAGPVRRRRAAGLIVGNVGWLQGGLPLLPSAQPDDGRLDVVVLSARGLASWAMLGLQVVLRTKGSRVFRSSITRMTIKLNHAQLWELDGEVVGTTRELTVAVHDDKLTLRVPADADLIG
jgi:YegS/Rv2252/BmrU family lipid kinase